MLDWKWSVHHTNTKAIYRAHKYTPENKFRWVQPHQLQVTLASMSKIPSPHTYTHAYAHT